MCVGGGGGVRKNYLKSLVLFVEVSVEGTGGLRVMAVRREIITVLQSTVIKREYEVFLSQQKNESARNACTQ